MKQRNPLSPWNPAEPVEISPAQYEKQVVAWLQRAGNGLRSFRVEHQAKIAGSSGEYTFDAIAEFEVFGGARILVLVECKRHADPVKRDDLLTLEAKLRDVGAQKAMLFSTAGFQSGAVEYATQRRIATITLIDGQLTYETRSGFEHRGIVPLVHIPRFCGWCLTSQDGALRTSLISEDRVDDLERWITAR